MVLSLTPVRTVQDKMLIDDLISEVEQLRNNLDILRELVKALGEYIRILDDGGCRGWYHIAQEERMRELRTRIKELEKELGEGKK